MTFYRPDRLERLYYRKSIIFLCRISKMKWFFGRKGYVNVNVKLLRPSGTDPISYARQQYWSLFLSQSSSMTRNLWEICLSFKIALGVNQCYLMKSEQRFYFLFSFVLHSSLIIILWCSIIGIPSENIVFLKTEVSNSWKKSFFVSWLKCWLTFKAA